MWDWIDQINCVPIVSYLFFDLRGWIDILVDLRGSNLVRSTLIFPILFKLKHVILVSGRCRLPDERLRKLKKRALAVRLQCS